MEETCSRIRHYRLWVHMTKSLSHAKVYYPLSYPNDKNPEKITPMHQEVINYI
jgi:ribosome-binding factor A